MALIDLKTNLKSLKYGRDSLGGGGSSQPYIVTPLPENANTLQKFKIDAAAYSSDTLIRGGALAAVNAATDLIRIGKFFLDAPKGPLFVIKQVGLQLSNPKIETGKVFLGLENTRLYNLGLNTLAQIPVGGFGVHFERHGLLPVVVDQQKYESVVNRKNLYTPEDNRLVKLYNNFILNLGGIEFNPKLLNRIHKVEDKIRNVDNTKLGAFFNKISGGGVSAALNNTLNKLERAYNPKYFEVDSYVGGPGSVYGIGKTTLRRYSFTDNPRSNDIINPVAINWQGLLGLSIGLYPLNIEDNKEKALVFTDEIRNVTNHPFPQTEGTSFTSTHIYDEIQASVNGERGVADSHLNSLTYDYALIKKQQIASQGSDFVGLIGTDFRDNINKDFGKTVLPVTTKEFNMITRLGIGSPGKVNRDRLKVSTVDPDTLDKINLIPLTTGSIDSDGKIGKYNTRDIIKFRFEAVNNNNPKSETTKILFRAFITGFGDDYSAKWAEHQYVGRGEEFYTYQGFKRSISFNLKIAAQSRAEMRPLYQKLNYFISNLMPDYNSHGFMRGSFMLFTMGSWLYRQPCVLNHIKINIADEYPWEIAMNEPENGDDVSMAELPQVLDLAITLTPIHNFLPRKGAKVPFIATGRRSENNYIGDVTGASPVDDPTNSGYF